MAAQRAYSFVAHAVLRAQHLNRAGASPDQLDGLRGCAFPPDLGQAAQNRTG